MQIRFVHVLCAPMMFLFLNRQNQDESIRAIWAIFFRKKFRRGKLFLKIGM